MISDTDLFGLDLDWFSVDSTGHIGHFTSNGSGLVPREAIASAQDLKRLTDFFRREVPIRCIGLESTGWRSKVRPEEATGKLLDSWLEMAARGLYSFDATLAPAAPAYIRIAYPAQPLTEHELPHHIRMLLEKVGVTGVSFGTAHEIRPQHLGGNLVVNPK
jgi:hypothetical protein